MLTSLFATVAPLQQSFSSEFTYSVSASSNTLTFRDITNADTTFFGGVSTDKLSYQVGETAILTVDDFNANVAITFVEFASVGVVQPSSSTTVDAEETDISTGFFIGDFLITDNIEITFSTSTEVNPDAFLSYTPDPPESARASVTVDLSSGGDVTIADFIIDDNEIVNLCFRPVIHAAEISFSNGAAQTASTDMEVTLSYANAILLPGDSVNLLQMYYKEPLLGYKLVRSSHNSEGHDPVGKTITSVPAQAGFIPGLFDGVTQGQFILGFETGCGGGGGGGLVRPGLVVNALAGLSAAVAGGGGGGPPGPTLTLGALALYDSAVEIISMPQEIRDIALNHDPHTPLEPITDIYEDFDFPLSINGNGFVLGDYENTLQTQTIEPGEPTEFVLVYYTNSEIAHSSLNFNLGPTRTIAGSDTQVLLYNDKPVEIIDPNGNIASATGSINNEGDLKRVATFFVTFSESAELPNPDMVIRSWNDQLNSGDTIVYDAIEIASPEIVEIADEDIPEPEIQTLKSQYVPIWIKNNAAWWSQELIEDSDFVAGIEYLIQQEIILISDSGDVTNTSNEIPSWIKNNAGWWSEDLITEKEFIDGLQWLVSNGIIQVTET